jgi:hypothetical protein
MRAELAGIEPGRARWRFVAGCLRVVATQQRMPSLGYAVLVVGALVTAVELTATVAYGPLRWGLFGFVTLLVAVSWLGRRPGLFGPVGPDRVARLVRGGGYLLVGGMASYVVLWLRAVSDPGQKVVGVPVYTVLVTLYLVGFLAATASGAPATARVLATGFGCGLAAAAAWLALVFAWPPIPASIGPAVGLIGAAMGAAAWANRRRGAGLATLCAGTVAVLPIVLMVAGLSRYGPAGLIPNIVPDALTPADRLANSRIEIEDPYVALLVLGALTAATLAVASRRSYSSR